MRIEKYEQLDTVDIIASGYEWVCPVCGELNRIIAYPKTGTVICQYEGSVKCNAKFVTDLPEHCFE